jgi:hypothetical protein
MRIEADLFSGRPNPVWTATEEEARQVGEILRRLGAAAPAAAPFDGLGYRGMVLREVEPALHPCPELRVAQGTVHAACPGEPRTFQDPGRALERMLVGLAARHVDADVHGLLRRMAGLD